METNAGDPFRQVEAWLATAGCILVKQCAAPLSIEWSGSSDAKKALADRSAAAIRCLDRVSALLEGTHADAEALWRARDRLEMLRAFAEVFASLARTEGSDESSQRLLVACNGLAPYLDDANPAVVESAKLWTGLAYRRAGRPERALQVLRPIITAPSSRRIGFLARIQRCRALGQAGEHAAGVALCLRLSARVAAWLADEDEATKRKAVDTVRFVRVGLLRDWAEALREQGEIDRADAAAAEAQKLLGDDAYPPAPDAWLNLGESIAGISEEGSLGPTSRLSRAAPTPQARRD
jgi:hypothetical protein